METPAIEKLKRDAPELYNEIINRGIMMERSRVLAHLNVAKIYNSLWEAVEAVESGEAVTESYPYNSLHDRYALIEDERDKLDELAGW